MLSLVRCVCRVPGIATLTTLTTTMATDIRFPSSASANLEYNK